MMILMMNRLVWNVDIEKSLKIRINVLSAHWTEMHDVSIYFFNFDLHAAASIAVLNLWRNI